MKERYKSMKNEKRTLAERLQEILDLLGKMMNPNAPVPTPAPVRKNEERPRRK
jgi:hypothetical protein